MLFVSWSAPNGIVLLGGALVKSTITQNKLSNKPFYDTFPFDDFYCLYFPFYVNWVREDTETVKKRKKVCVVCAACYIYILGLLKVSTVQMSGTFLRVTWIDIDREIERDVSTREQKSVFKLDVNVKVSFLVLWLVDLFCVKRKNTTGRWSNERRRFRFNSTASSTRISMRDAKFKWCWVETRSLARPVSMYSAWPM